MSRRDRAMWNDQDPIHLWFGLTYASYLVLPRTLLQAMPQDFQRRFARLLCELDEHWDGGRIRDSYEVRLRNPATGMFEADPLAQYRHPDVALIESLRRKNRR